MFLLLRAEMLCFLAAVMLLLFIQPDLARANDCVSGDPLNCLLNSIDIHIIPAPNMTIPLCETVAGQTLCIYNLTCYGINIDSIPSTYVPMYGVDFGISNLGTDCIGDYTYKPIIGKAQPGTLTAIVSDTDFILDLVVGTKGMYPWSTTIDYCNYTSSQVNVEFTTSSLESFAPTIERIIKKALKQLVCGKLVELIDVNLTSTIQNDIDPNLYTIVAYGPDKVPDYGSAAINWNDSLFDIAHGFIGKISYGPLWPCLVEQIPELANFTRPIINRVIDKATNGTGIFVIDLNGTSTMISNTSSLIMNYVTVGGLDTFHDMYLLEPSATEATVLSTQIGLREFFLEFDFTLVIAEGNYTYFEELKVTTAVANITVDLDLNIAVDKEARSKQHLFQIFEPSCFVETFIAFDVSSFVLNLDINELQLTEVTGNAGLLESSLVAFADNFLLMVTHGFGNLTTALILGLGQGPIRASINAGLNETVYELLNNATCPSAVPADDEPIVWSNSTIIKFVNGILDDKVGAAGIDNIVNCLTDGTGELVITTETVNISLAGLNTFTVFDLLEPVPNDPYGLTTHIQITGPVSINISSLTPQSTLFYNNLDPESTIAQVIGIALGSQEKDVFSDQYSQYVMPSVYSELGAVGVDLPSGWYVYMELSDLMLGIRTDIVMNKADFANLTLGELGTTGCVGSTIKSFTFNELNISVANATLTIKEGTKQLPNIIKVIDLVLSLITSDKHIETMNANIQDNLSKAAATCENGGIYPDSSNVGGDSIKSNWTWELTLLVIGCFLSLVGFLWLGRKYSKEGNKMCQKGISDEDDKSLKKSASLSSSDESKFDWTIDGYKRSGALFFQQKIPLWVRIAFPLAILTDIYLFLWVNWFAPNAVWVLATIEVDGQTFTPPPTFKFGLKNTVEDMWEAKTYTLAILIAFFSGAWPYVKLLVMLWGWMAPLALLPVHKRESWLMWLDFLGKWSLIDFFVMVMMMCAFYFTLPLAPELTVKVFVQPNWGFYGFLLATMISLGLGHIVLAFHRLIVQPKIVTDEIISAESESLFNHSYSFLYKLGDKDNESTASANANEQSDYHDFDNHTGVKKRYFRLTNFGGGFIIFMTLLTSFFILVGTFEKTFNFEFKGLTGLLLGDAAEVAYSLVSCGTTVPTASGHPDQFAVRWMEVSFLCFGLGFPLALMFVLLLMWFYPFRLKTQKTLFTLAEVLNAWSALDVFCVAIAAALLEIQQFAAFIVGDSCDGINEILKKYLNEQLDGDDKCFDVIATLTSKAWLIFFAASLMIAFCWPTLAIFHAALDDRLKAQARRAFLNSENSEKAATFGVKDERMSVQSNASLEDFEDVEAALKMKWSSKLLRNLLDGLVFCKIIRVEGDKYVRASPPPSLNSGPSAPSSRTQSTNVTSMRHISEDFYSPMTR